MVALVSSTVALAAIVWTVTLLFNAVPFATPSFAVESVSALLWIPVILAIVGVMFAFVSVTFTVISFFNREYPASECVSVNAYSSASIQLITRFPAEDGENCVASASVADFPVTW